MFLKKVILVFILLILSVQVFSNESINNKFFDNIINDKKSLNKKVTQIEFIVLMGRFLDTTNDLAPEKLLKQLNNVPKWAE